MKLYLGYYKIDWKEVNVTFNSNIINLPKFDMIKF